MKIGSILTLECGCSYHLILLILIHLLTVSKWLLTAVDHRLVGKSSTDTKSLEI